MAVRVILDAEHRITVPVAMREKLRIEQGSTLLVDVQDGVLIARPEGPDDPVERLHGLHREIWQDVNPDEYIRQEREAWPE